MESWTEILGLACCAVMNVTPFRSFVISSPSWIPHKLNVDGKHGRAIDNPLLDLRGGTAPGEVAEWSIAPHTKRGDVQAVI
jgi:hypothetical protein